MKKYLETFRLSFKMQMIWRFDVLMSMAAAAARISAAWILWSAVYARRDRVGGFTFEAMLSYYIVGAFVASLDKSSHISSEISWLIHDGRFSGRMVTPMNPLGFFGCMTAGESAFHLGFNFLAVMVCVLLLRFRIVPAADAASAVLAAAMIPMGLVFMMCYHSFVGILTFKFQEIEFMLYLQGNIIAFATGSLVPLSLMPDAVLSALRFLPFTHVAFTPVMLLTGQARSAEGLLGLAVLAAWTAAAALSVHFMYHRLRIRYDGVGL